MSVLGNYVQILGGGTPSRDVESYWEGDVPWATVKDLTSKHISETYESITERGVDNCATQIVPAGTLLLATRMALGRMSITTVPMAFNQDLKALVINGKIDQTYLYYFLLAKESYFISRGNGATVKGFKVEDIRSLPFDPPPLPEQRRIAAILDKAQALVANDKRTLAVYDQLAKSLFLELFGDPVRNERGWEVVTIGDLVDYMTSGSRGWAKYYADEGEPFLRIQNVRRDELLLNDLTYVNAPDNTEAKRTCVRDGDVLVSITADLGRSAAIPKGLGVAYINQHLAILRLNEKVDPEYLSGYLATDAGAIQFARVNKGGVKAGLNFNDLRSIEVPLPPLELQKRYSKLKLRTRADRKTIEDSLRQSEALFGSLLQQAFSGAIAL